MSVAKNRKNIAIIGAGNGGNSLLEILVNGKYTSVVGIADCNPLAPGLRAAELLGVPTFIDYRDMLKSVNYDIVVNVTGSLEVEYNINKLKSDGAEVLSGSCAHLIWDLIDEHLRSRNETKKRLRQFQDLYHLGLTLSSSQNLREVNNTAIDYATKLIKCPAGSIVLIDKNSDELILAGAKGFTPDFYKNKRWRFREGGLTQHVMRRNSPVVISDVAKYRYFDNEIIIKEGIKSIAAAPLSINDKTLGIIYLDDFKEHQFSQEDVYILTLISTYTALAVERTKLLEETQKLVITDSLTGLYNHRHLFSRLDEEFDRARRYNHPLAVVTFDIDFFKKYNDSHGHLRGNEALRSIGKLINDNSRHIDICARTGGEEFVILMPETNKRTAGKLAERLRRKIEEHHFKGEESQPGGVLTISLGVAELSSGTPNSVDLLNQADQALYEAKRRGRNQVVMYEAGIPDIGAYCEWSAFSSKSKA